MNKQELDPIEKEHNLPISSNQLDRLVKNLIGFLETHFKLIQLEVKEELAKSITKLIIGALVAMFAALATLLASIALAIWLGERFDSMPLGFLAVSGIYFLCIIVILSLFKLIKNKVNQYITQPSTDEE